MQDATPTVVYHYATIPAMMSIVKSATIWATSVCYLNDVTEQDHFLGMLRRLLPDFLHRTRLDTAQVATLEVLKENPPRSFAFRPFVTSFSQHDDSLPLWRSYCPNGNGVAVGFRVDCLKRSSVKGSEVKKIAISPSFAKVEYLDTATVDGADETFQMLLKGATSLSHPPSRLTSAEWCQYLASRYACTYKHHSFQNEAEFRLVSDGVENEVSLLNFRPGRSTLVPYLEFSIPKWHSEHSAGGGPPFNPLAGRWQFIDRLVIGPTPNMELTRVAVEAYFRSKGIYVEVESSNIPFREL